MSATADAQDTAHPQADWHAMTPEEVLSELQSHDAGLSSDEVLQRREKYGRNKLAEKPPVPGWKKFLEQFQDPMVYLLIAAAIIATLFHPEELGTPIFIVFALTLNAFFGYLQEAKAEEAMKSLKKLLLSLCSPAANSPLLTGKHKLRGWEIEVHVTVRDLRADTV